MSQTEAEILGHIRKAIQDVKLHDHDREDWFCLNLQAWLGERAWWLVARINERDERIAELERKASEWEAFALEWKRQAQASQTERNDALAQLEWPAIELPTVALPWAGPGIRVRVDDEDDSSGDIAVELVDDIGTLWLNADEATEAAAALLAAARASRDITGERPTINLHAPALAAEPIPAVA